MIAALRVLRRHYIVVGFVIAGVAAIAFAQGGPGSSNPANPTAMVSTQRFEDYIRAHEREHEMLNQAIGVAKQTTDQRLEGMNELRAQITQERAAYATSVGVEALRQRIDKLEQAQASQAGSSATWVIVVGVFFTILQLAMRFLPPKK
jgi:hypothetical protein